MLSHRDGGVHEGVCVHTGVDAEGIGGLQVGSDQLNRGIPAALWHQDVWVLCIRYSYWSVKVVLLYLIEITQLVDSMLTRAGMC